MEILLILAIVVLVFGAGKVKNIGAALGRSGKEFKKALENDEPAKEEASETETIDITPQAERDDDSKEPKPGKRKQPIDDAEWE